MCVVLISMTLSACGKDQAEEIPEPAETVVAEEEPEVIEEVVEEEPEKEEVLTEGTAKAYLDAIKKYGQDYEKFALVYIDKSGRSQLSMLNEDYFLSVFSIDDNDNLIDFGKSDMPDWETGVWGLGTYGRYLSFYEKSGIIRISERGEGGTGEWNTFYSLDNDSLEEVWSGGYEGLFDDNGDPILDTDGDIKNDDPTVNGQTVTMDEYNTELSKYTEGDGELIPLSVDEGNYMSKEEMVSYLSSFMNGNDDTNEAELWKVANKDYTWINDYLKYISDLDTYPYSGAAIIYVNDDEIPEIVLDGTSEQTSDNSGYLLLTVSDNKVSTKQMLGDFDSIRYIPGNNLIESSYFHMGGSDTVCGIDPGSWKVLFDGRKDDLGWDDSGNWNVEYYISDTKVSEDEYGVKYNEVFNDDKAESVEFSYSVDELKEELSKLRAESDSKKYKDIEPWKLAYRNCLYDVMAGLINLAFGNADYTLYADGETVFALQDITEDGIPELLVGGYPKNIYTYDSNEDKGYTYLGWMNYYDTEDKRIYTESGSVEYEYDICRVEEGKIIHEKGYSGPYEENEDEYTSYNEYADGKDREITKEEWNAFVDKYNIGLKKYELGYIDLNPENIDKELGFPSGNTESKGETEKKEDGKLDNSLYKVEVTAPDGYVNFRTGAGADYEIISQISNGEILSVVSDDGKWLQIEYNGKTGWIAASQVTRKRAENARLLN